MEAAIKRIVLRLFPALSAGYHLPRFAKVEAITEPQVGGEQCTPERPYYAVDLQVLTEHGQPETKIPILKDVALPTFFAGPERGLYGKPAIGTWVEIAFAYGSPNRPFIRTILPHGLPLTELPEGAQRWQQTQHAYQQIDQDNHWIRTTDTTITDASKNYTQQVEKVADRMAKLKQRIKVEDGGKIWLGNESDNVLKILDDTIQLLGQVASTAAGHNHNGVHGPTSAPNQAGDFTGQASTATTLHTKLDPLVE